MPLTPTADVSTSDKTIKVRDVNAYNPEYDSVIADWSRLALLYEGGSAIKQQAPQFLVKRPKELPEVYQARCSQFSYHNILGTCFGWYHAALFKSPPIVALSQMGGDASKPQPLDDATEKFYNSFRGNCDRKRTSLVDLTRDLWTNLALYSCGYILVDLPPKVDPGQAPKSLLEQKQTGVLDSTGKPVPHLVSYSPINVINWSLDTYGILEWAVLRTQEIRGAFLEKRQVVDVWLYFDREQYTRYERVRKDSSNTGWSATDDDQPVTVVDSGPHALAAAKIVPLQRFEVPSALWLANRAYLPIVDHLNADNTYGWALFMANLAMPVIISSGEVSPTLTEAGFIKLPEGSTYEWSEPKGTSFMHAAKRVEELRQESYRLMYLIYQGRTANATADGTSGASKEMDMMPAQDVMNEYGDVIVAATQRILDLVAAARGDDTVHADVRGMKFGKTATLEQIQKTEAVLSLAIPSETFTKEVYKQAAAEFLPDANPEMLTVITGEIEKAPSIQKQLTAMSEAQQQQYQTALEGSVAGYVKTPPTPIAKSPPVEKKTLKVVNN